MTELDALQTMTWKGFWRNTSITPCATLNGYLCANCVKASICTVPLAFVATKTEASDNGLRVTVRTDGTSPWLQSCSAYILAKMSFCCSSVLLVSFSCAIMISMGRQLNGAIFLSLGKVPLINLYINDVPKRSGTAKFLIFPNRARMRLFPIQTCKAIFLTTSTFSLVALFGRRRS